MHPQSTEPQAGTVRVAFDVMAGVEPLTFPADATNEQITARLRRAFLAAEAIDVDDEFTVVIGDEVKLLVDGNVIEHGSITRVDEQPAIEQDLRRVAYDLVLAGVAAGMPLPETIGLHYFGVLEIQVSDNDTASVDAWRAHLSLPAPTLSQVLKAARDFRTYEARAKSYPGLPGWDVKVLTFIDEPTAGGAR